jgi:hypothetical protein
MSYWIEHLTLHELCHHPVQLHQEGEKKTSLFDAFPPQQRLSDDDISRFTSEHEIHPPTHDVIVGVVLLHSTWNRLIDHDVNSATLSSNNNVSIKIQSRMLSIVDDVTAGLLCHRYAAAVLVDETPESLDFFIGDNNINNSNTRKRRDDNDVDCSSSNDDQFLPPLPVPPSELPILAVFVHQLSKSASSPRKDAGYTMTARYIRNVRSLDIWCALGIIDNHRQHVNSCAMKSSTDSFHQSFLRLTHTIRLVMEDIEHELDLDVDWSLSCNHTAIRIFVAGDRSSVGKSSICLGILGSLVQSNQYLSHRLAYIKPATQSESPQLIQQYCHQHSITCRPIGPLVYYRGFTRAYLAQNTPSTEQLLQSCVRAVDRVARNKDIVLIDGVGFPAVGSICGTDNATMALVCGYHPSTLQLLDKDNQDMPHHLFHRTPCAVLLVGGSGVGGAVDAFNLNATYFSSRGVPVLGGVFNKLPLDGYYSLESCREQVTRYFEIDTEQRQMLRRPYGFLPLFPQIAGLEGMKYVEEYIHLFQSHVDVDGIVDAAKQARNNTKLLLPASKHPELPLMLSQSPLAKRMKVTPSTLEDNKPSHQMVLSREQIEQEAIKHGAAPSA